MWAKDVKNYFELFYLRWFKNQMNLQKFWEKWKDWHRSLFSFFRLKNVISWPLKPIICLWYICLSIFSWLLLSFLLQNLEQKSPVPRLLWPSSPQKRDFKSSWTELSLDERVLEHGLWAYSAWHIRLPKWLFPWRDSLIWRVTMILLSPNYFVPWARAIFKS